MKKVAVIMGSDSDFPVVRGALVQLKKFGVPFEARVLSAHRTPAEAEEFAKHAEENGFGVIIAAAGKAAHLGGVLAAQTILPVIGLPIKFLLVWMGWTAFYPSSRCLRESPWPPLALVRRTMQDCLQCKCSPLVSRSWQKSSEIISVPWQKPYW